MIWTVGGRGYGRSLGSGQLRATWAEFCQVTIYRSAVDVDAPAPRRGSFLESIEASC